MVKLLVEQRRRSERALEAERLGSASLRREAPAVSPVRRAHCVDVRGARGLRRLRARARRRRRGYRPCGLAQHHAADHGPREHELRHGGVLARSGRCRRRVGLVGSHTALHGGGSEYGAAWRPTRPFVDGCHAGHRARRAHSRARRQSEFAAQAAAAVSGARQRPRLRLDARDRCDTAAARGQDVRYRGHEAADRARRAARPAQRERRHADHGGCRLRLARVRHPRSRTRNSALRDERRRAEVDRGFASAGRRRRRRERGDHGRRTR